jgi:cytidylate kinase
MGARVIMAVITISRQFGAGGLTLGERLAGRLGYRYVNEEMITEVAKRAGASPDQIKAFEDSGATRLMRFLDRVVSTDYINRLISDRYTYVDEKKYTELIRAIIQDLHRKGNVVIIGRGSQYILKGHLDVLHLLLVADIEHRIRFIMDKYALSKKASEKAVRRAEEIRARFLSFFEQRQSHDDPLSYHLVLNTGLLSMEKAEELVMHLISK